MDVFRPVNIEVSLVEVVLDEYIVMRHLFSCTESRSDQKVKEKSKRLIFNASTQRWIQNNFSLN